MKKVLIITYYWPPAGGPGVQRWLKFVKYLPEYNIEPIVYIPENPSYPLEDKELLQEISPNLTILKHKITEPYNWASLFSKQSTKKISSGIIPSTKKQSVLQKLMLWVRGNFFIPDARILWVRPSIVFLKDYISKNNIDTIITTGPPHSLHLTGLGLKEKLNIKWIADFRDPWTTIGYHKELKLSSSAAKKHKELESKVLQAADKIIVTSPATKKEFEGITSKPITVITNGYDIENIGRQPLDEKFTLAHIGSFLSERNPRILWKALSELIKENQDFKKYFRLKLIGAVSQEVLNAVHEFRLTNHLDNLGYLPHSEALKHQKKSQVLLLIEINSEAAKAIIPGKLFEYMVSERPILGIGPEHADFASILQSTNTGIFVSYEEKEKLKQVLLDYFNAYLENNLKVYAIGLQQYSRKNLTRQLSELLN